MQSPYGFAPNILLGTRKLAKSKVIEAINQ